MRKVKHLGVLVILGALSLSGIAFSSWVSTNPSHSFDVDIDVSPVITMSDYVYLDTSKGNNNSGITNLKYCEEGFIDNNNYVSLSSKIVFYFIVNGTKTHDYYGALNLANFQLDFKATCLNESSSINLNLFSNSYFECDSKVFYDQNSNFSQQKEVNTIFNNSIQNTSSCSVTTNTTDNIYLLLVGKNNLYFKYEYTFTIRPNVDFRNNVYTALSNMQLTFNINLGDKNV